MSGLVESAVAIMRASEQRLEVAAHNTANVSTPGYKRRVGFAQLLASPDLVAEPTLATRNDFAQGDLRETGNPLDLAISGAGFFQLRAGDTLVYSRQGQFHLAEDGTVVTPQGYALQQAGGGDLVLQYDTVRILEDGTALDQDQPVARIALFTPGDTASLQAIGASHFTAPAAGMEEVAAPVLRQGMVEGSNVAMGDEMVSIMAAMRGAESGARLVQVYDDLIGRTITTFGGGR